MSDTPASDFDYYALGGTPVHDSQKPEKKDRRIFVLKIVVLVMAIALLVEGILYVFVIPCLAPAKIKISGLSTLRPAQVSQLLSPMANATWIQFDSEKAVSCLSVIPGIETISVDKHFPDRVIIQIKERVPVAKTIVTMQDRSIPVQIDENGVLFTSAGGSLVSDSSVPLVSGLPIDRVQEGMRLPQKYRGLIEQIATIRRLPQKYFAAISEIKVVPKEYGSYELVLYPVHMRVRVLTDRSLNEEALQYMMVALDVVNSIDPAVGEIDLRYGSVSYRRR